MNLAIPARRLGIWRGAKAEANEKFRRRRKGEGSFHTSIPLRQSTVTPLSAPLSLLRAPLRAGRSPPRTFRFLLGPCTTAALHPPPPPLTANRGDDDHGERDRAGEPHPARLHRPRRPRRRGRPRLPPHPLGSAPFRRRRRRPGPPLPMTHVWALARLRFPSVV